jgi:SAM-dependent methyltransferase
MVDDIWSVYDDMAPVFEATASDNAYNAHYDRPAVLALAGDVKGLRVLDAGCGPGFYTEALAERGASVVAFDASEAMVALARERVPSATVVRAVLGEPLPFADGEFDLVVSALAIHYAADRAAAFRELHRVVRPGGAVVLSTQHPTADWLRKGGSYFDVRVEEDVWQRDGRDYTVSYWREPLGVFCAAATDAGFLIERLVEPAPAESMRERWPDDWETLQREPAFLLLRLLRPVRP